jgi:hypothetical protein
MIGCARWAGARRPSSIPGLDHADLIATFSPLFRKKATVLAEVTEFFHRQLSRARQDKPDYLPCQGRVFLHNFHFNGGFPMNSPDASILHQGFAAVQAADRL